MTSGGYEKAADDDPQRARPQAVAPHPAWTCGCVELGATPATSAARYFRFRKANDFNGNKKIGDVQ